MKMKNRQDLLLDQSEFYLTANSTTQTATSNKNENRNKCENYNLLQKKKNNKIYYKNNSLIRKVKVITP